MPVMFLSLLWKQDLCDYAFCACVAIWMQVLHFCAHHAVSSIAIIFGSIVQSEATLQKERNLKYIKIPGVPWKI